ncbi:MAG: hypothetical protein IJ313_10485 [Clostridia bacterium]|nr:hypothetical protein [Clostridia bacterium]
MKVWTQAEYDSAKSDLNGIVDLGQGDFREIDFRGRHRVHVGPNSMIGNGARMGVGCEIGEGSEIGDHFRDEGRLKVGKNCHFGEYAHIDEHGIIGRGCCFATGVQICKDVELGEEVQLPTLCGYLFDVRAIFADGSTLIRLHPVAGRTICAFVCQWDGAYTAMVSTRGLLLPVDEWERRTKELLKTAEAGRRKNLLDAQDLHAAALFIKEHFERRAA